MEAPLKSFLRKYRHTETNPYLLLMKMAAGKAGSSIKLRNMKSLYKVPPRSSATRLSPKYVSPVASQTAPCKHVMVIS